MTAIVVSTAALLALFFGLGYIYARSLEISKRKSLVLATIIWVPLGFIAAGFVVVGQLLSS